MDEQDLCVEGSNRIKQAEFTMRIISLLLAQKEFSLEEALEVCARFRAHVAELFPREDALFDLLYAPRLRALIHRYYD